MTETLIRRIAVATLAVALVAASVATAPAARALGEVSSTPVRQIGGPGHAALYGWGMGTASDGTVYVSDYWNYRIQHYALDGSLIDTIVPPVWEGPGRHEPPYGVGVDPRNGDFWFGDVDDNATVDKYDANGNYLLSIGGLDNPDAPGEVNEPGKFLYPSFLDVMSDGRLVVADSRRHNVEVFDDAGAFLFSFGDKGDQVGEFDNPRGIGLDANDNIYVVDNNNARVQVFDSGGAFLHQIGSPSAPEVCPGPNGTFCPGNLGRANLRGLAVDETNGFVYVIDAISGQVNKFALDGTFVTRWGSIGHDDGEFADGGRDVTVAGDGTIWVGDMGNFRVQVFTPDGTFVMAVPNPPQPAPYGGFNQPLGVAVDTQGNFFVADTMNQRVEKFDVHGDFVTAWGERGASEYGFNYPRGIATDPRNDDVVVCDSDNGAVKKYDNDGNFIWERALGLKCKSIDVGPDGRIYLANFGTFTVSVIDENGDNRREIGAFGPGAGEFWNPRGVALDADESVWVVDDKKAIVQHFANDGTFLSSFGVRQAAETTTGEGFLQAADVVVDDTYVYVSDEDDSSVKVFEKDGTFVSELGGPGDAIGQLRNPYGMDLLPGGKLFIADRSADRIQQWQLSFSTGGGGDTLTPEGYVDVPHANQAMPITGFDITGSAVDDNDVATVKVAIRDRSTGDWWRGTGWGPFLWLNVPLPDIVEQVTPWSFHWDPPAPGDYAVQVRTEDAAGNVDPTTPFVLFSVYDGPPDAETPLTTIDTPAENEYLGTEAPTLSGAATDNYQVTGVDIAIQNRDTGEWLQSDQTWGGAYAPLEAILSDPNTPSTSWSFDWVPEPGDYGVRAVARDLANNRDPDQHYTPFSIYDGPADGAEPATTVDNPAANAYVPALALEVTGSASDDVAVTDVQVAVQDRTTGEWLQPDGVAWSIQFASRPATLDAPGTTVSGWSWWWTPPLEGEYAIWAQTGDIAGKVDSTASYVPFFVYPGGLDDQPPTTVTSYPTANGLVANQDIAFSGTASDNRSVTDVYISMRNVDTGEWWQPGGGWAVDFAAFDAGLDNPGGVLTGWSYTWTPPGPGTYAVQAQARDLANQLDGVPPYTTFTVYNGAPDSTPPDTTAVVPSGGQNLPLEPMTMSGGATDDVSGVAEVKVAIKNKDRNLWWTGSAWGTFTWLPATVDTPGATTTTWTYDWTPPEAAAYAMMVKSFDVAGNADPAVPWVSFRVYAGVPDDVAPDATIVVPSATQGQPLGPFTMSGAATDNVGVGGAQIAIKNAATNQWWTGSTWGGFTWLDATVTDPGATDTTWTYEWTPPTAGNYGMNVKAIDTAGNVDPTKPWRNFTVYEGAPDTTPPEGLVDLPVKNQTYPLAELTLSGSATDDQAVAAVRIAIKNRDTGLWWTGTAWAGFTWLNASVAAPGTTTTAWSFVWTPPEPALYGVMLQARDLAGNADPTKPWIPFEVTP